VRRVRQFTEQASTFNIRVSRTDVCWCYGASSLGLSIPLMAAPKLTSKCFKASG